MLTIIVPAQEFWNQKTEEFILVKEQKLSLEHSLVSLSKWESKWCVPFLSNDNKTVEQMRDYVRCMTLTQNVNPLVYQCLTDKNYEAINSYIQAPMTATWFSDNNKPRGNKIVTAEVIYYWMVALQIPFECQKWHLNRLLTLIKVCNEESQPKKKMSKADIMSKNRALNAKRKAKHHTRG